MTNPIIKDVNVETGQEIEREMNAEELAQYQIDVTNFEAAQQADTDRATLRAEVLNKLGLTSDEVAALLG